MSKQTKHLPRFAVYPGNVVSLNDGDVHYIGFRRLCELYKVQPDECVDATYPETRQQYDLSKLIPLRPSRIGNYNLPKNQPKIVMARKPSLKQIAWRQCAWALYYCLTPAQGAVHRVLNYPWISPRTKYIARTITDRFPDLLESVRKDYDDYTPPSTTPKQRGNNLSPLEAEIQSFKDKEM